MINKGSGIVRWNQLLLPWIDLLPARTELSTEGTVKYLNLGTIRLSYAWDSEHLHINWMQVFTCNRNSANITDRPVESKEKGFTPGSEFSWGLGIKVSNKKELIRIDHNFHSGPVFFLYNSWALCNLAPVTHNLQGRGQDDIPDRLWCL